MTCPGLKVTLGFTQWLTGKESTGSAAGTGDPEVRSLESKILERNGNRFKVLLAWRIP